MKKIRVSKEFAFETAHALDMHDSKCRNIHGHSYKLTITVLGPVNEDDSQPNVGMVIDVSFEVSISVLSVFQVVTKFCENNRLLFAKSNNKKSSVFFIINRF